MKTLTLLVVILCCGCALSPLEPRRSKVIPVGEDSVALCPDCVRTTPVAPVDSAVLCSLYWHPGAICWQVVDSIRPSLHP
jgi:hypothetical protein